MIMGMKLGMKLDISSFENFIMSCCKMEEESLRNSLKEILVENGFNIKEDKYESERGMEYSGVHNMLCIRGNPKVCLVAHTDVCRDHEEMQGVGSEHTSAYMEVHPVIRGVEHKGEEVLVIQDRDKRAQVGGDDRLGVAINVWNALKNKDIALLFTTDEEIGLISAGEVEFAELMGYELLIQVDRGNRDKYQLVTKIKDTEICDAEMSGKLLKIADEMGKVREEVKGLSTDVYAIKKRGKCKNAVNMTCGYHESYGSDPNEYIVLTEAWDTMEYVGKIIESFE